MVLGGLVLGCLILYLKGMRMMMFQLSGYYYTVTTSPWCLVGNGGMDPYYSPYIIPNNCRHNPFPHSLLRTRRTLGRIALLENLIPKPLDLTRFQGLGFRV